MDITPYVDHLRRDLLAAADGAGDELRGAAERLGFALDPAARLALMEAISQACAEITAEMPDGGVDVRLEGRDLAFVVDSAAPAPPSAPLPPTPPSPPTPPAPPGEEAEEGGMARITLRLPESVKGKAEDAAAAAGQSLNTWLVTVIRAATRGGNDRGPGAVHVDVDLSSIFREGFGDRGKRGNRRMTGWV
ncbi:pilus assembly protein HicB [Nocardioides sp. GXZ039]|uniref:pilus assembly protein HicB n=1 Tax=Nocardioides sp. GXZ039 TaxID=3136018 RepID=UPI0030F377CC